RPALGRRAHQTDLHRSPPASRASSASSRASSASIRCSSATNAANSSSLGPSNPANRLPLLDNLHHGALSVLRTGQEPAPTATPGPAPHKQKPGPVQRQPRQTWPPRGQDRRIGQPPHPIAAESGWGLVTT